MVIAVNTVIVVSFQSYLIFHTCRTISFDLNTFATLARKIYFPATYIFFAFCSPNCSNSFVVFYEYHERQPLLEQKLSAMLIFELKKSLKGGKIRM